MCAGKKPVIGVVPLVDEARASLWMLPGYLEGVQAAGGVPVVLPLTDDGADIARLTELCDGFLFTGGHDVGPALYGEETLPVCGTLCPERDRMEQPLLLAAIAADKSILGICRGLQFINATLGGTLYQDLPAQYPSDCGHHMKAPYDRHAHQVALIPGTPLAACIGGREMGVNSCHHQGIRELGPRLSVMAEAPDGLIEAAYLPECSFAWAVQWHPEFSRKTDPNSQKIFDVFVGSAREKGRKMYE